MLVRQLKSEQVNVQRAAVQELLLLASTSNVLGAAIRHASGDRQLMRVVHRHSSSATIYSSNWSLLRWSLATLNALAVDDISRKRQAPIIESAISVCVQGLDLDAQGDGFGSPAVPDARHAVAEAASLVDSALSLVAVDCQARALVAALKHVRFLEQLYVTASTARSPHSLAVAPVLHTVTEAASAQVVALLGSLGKSLEVLQQEEYTLAGFCSKAENISDSSNRNSNSSSRGTGRFSGWLSSWRRPIR